MQLVFLCALGVGGATALGAVLGFIFKNLTHRFSDVVLAFSAGVMLSSSFVGLILPSLENGGKYGIISTVSGILVGAFSLNIIDKLVPHLHKYVEVGDVPELMRSRRVMLFVTAIALHNLPEGIAAGVGFGCGDLSSALLIAGSIALQNVPEGMVLIAPMLSVGMKPSRALVIALGTGLVEVIGTVVGYFGVTVSGLILPFALAFAGGTMLYIISDEIIPDTHADGVENGATYALLVGLCFVLIFNWFL